MPRAGIRSGEFVGKRAKLDGKQAVNREFISIKAWQTNGAMRSGVINFYDAGFASFSKVTSGIAILGWDKVTETGTSKADIVLSVPSNIGPNTKANVNLFWITSGAIAGDGLDGNSRCVWDIDYVPVFVHISGVPVSAGAGMFLSGALANATTTHVTVSGTTAGVLQKTAIAIPDTAIRPGSVVKLMLYRDGADTADTLYAPAYVVATEVEYTDG